MRISDWSSDVCSSDLGSIPGHAYADLRRPLVTSLNLCDMLPISANWSGPTINSHLSDVAADRGEPSPVPPLMHTRTDGTTPFRFDLHQGDVGHTMVIGPTGAGKRSEEARVGKGGGEQVRSW